MTILLPPMKRETDDCIDRGLKGVLEEISQLDIGNANSESRQRDQSPGSSWKRCLQFPIRELGHCQSRCLLFIFDGWLIRGGMYRLGQKL